MINLKHLTPVCVLLVASSLNAQENFAQITGIVRGPDGNPVAGANISLTSPVLLMPRSAVTDATGRYRIQLLSPGEYVIRVSMQGYIGSQATLRVASGSVMSSDLRLRQITTAGQEVEITGGANPTVDKTETKVSTTFTGAQLEALPTGGLTGIYAAAILAPGVSGRDYPKMRGGATGTTQFLLNGVTMRDAMAGQGRQYEMLVDDMIEDIQVIQNPINAKYGFSNSGLITATTKTGTNTFKGTFRTQMANQAWMTYNDGPWTNRFGEALQGSPISEPWSSYNINTRLDNLDVNYHVTFSGPIIKDRLTFAYGSRLQPKLTDYSTRANLLGGNPDNNNTYMPGLRTTDPRYTGPNPLPAFAGTQSPEWAAYYWGANPEAPTRSLPIWATNDDTFASYKFFWQINENHQIEWNYTDNKYKSGVNISGYLGDMNNQQGSNRLNRSISYRGIVGNGVLTALAGGKYSRIYFAHGPDDPIYISTWGRNALGLLERESRNNQTLSGGSTGAPSQLRNGGNGSIDYNYIWENHNLDVGIQYMEDITGSSPGGLNGVRYYVPGRMHDGSYLVFNATHPDSPFNTGVGLNLLDGESLLTRQNWLLSNRYLPTYEDWNDLLDRNWEIEGKTYSVYINDNWTINDFWAVNVGLRLDNCKLTDVTGERANSTSIVPRLRVQWDMDGDNKHVFAFSATQARGTLAQVNMGAFAVTGGSMQRRYIWDQGTSAEPYFVDYNAIKNTSNYGTYAYFTDSSMTYFVDPDLKPDLTTTVELQYRRAFDRGGFYRISLVHNYTSDLMYGAAVDEAIELSDPTGAVPVMAAAYGYKRYLSNRSDRKRHYTSAEIDYYMPLISRETFRVNMNGMWTVAKAMGNASYSGTYSGWTGGETSTLMFYDQLEKIGIPKEWYDPWNEQGGVPRHKASMQIMFEHGVRGGITNDVTLVGYWESGSAAGSTRTYTLPGSTWANSNVNGGMVSDFPSATTSLYVWGPRGSRRGYSQYRVDLQWNVNVPIRKQLSVFMNMMIGNVFNSFVPPSHYTSWTVGPTRIWNAYDGTPGWTGDPQASVLVASQNTGQNWGVNGITDIGSGPFGQRRYWAGNALGYFYNGQFDLGIRF